MGFPLWTLFGMGMTAFGALVMLIIAYIAQKSPQVFVVTDSSKFGKMELTRYFGAEDVDYVITDEGIPAKEKTFLEKAGTHVIIV